VLGGGGVWAAAWWEAMTARGRGGGGIGGRVLGHVDVSLSLSPGWLGRAWGGGGFWGGVERWGPARPACGGGGGWGVWGLVWTGFQVGRGWSLVMLGRMGGEVGPGGAGFGAESCFGVCGGWGVRGAWGGAGGGWWGDLCGGEVGGSFWGPGGGEWGTWAAERGLYGCGVSAWSRQVWWGEMV